jgi:hypothetical protein
MGRKIAAARPVDHAARMESSRFRLGSRRLYRRRRFIICETRVTINRAMAGRPLL